DRGERIARIFGDRASQKAWAETARAVKEELLARGVSCDGKCFVAAYGTDAADAATLLVPIHGLIEPSHPLALGTIARVRSELGEGPFLRRYLTDDGVGGPEGAFVLCGFWLAEALA